MKAFPSPSFWKGRRVLVTGHTGYKGAWLSYWLASMGAELHGIALEPAHQTLFAKASLNTLFRSSRYQDILEAEAFQQHVRRLQPEVVFHLAGVAIVSEAEAQPERAFAVNCGGTQSLLETLPFLNSLKAAVFITTDKVYGGTTPAEGFGEEHSFNPHGVYATSKAEADLRIQRWKRHYPLGMKVAIARAGNCIGGGDITHGRLIPDILWASLSREPLLIRNLHAVRPWQHVLEPLRGYLLMAEALMSERLPRSIEAINFGPGAAGETSVKEVLELMGRMGLTPEVVTLEQNLLPDEHILRLSITRATETLNWYPRLTLSDTLELAVAFQKSFFHSDQLGVQEMEAELRRYYS
jgi:CDP-glucose 4,6-dehydratase